MSKLGLYAVDTSMDNSTIRAAANKLWNRTGLLFDGKFIENTSIETNKLGVYSVDGKLMLNGSQIADTKDVLATDAVSEGTVKFGNITLSSDNICINITLENYNKLRAGVRVDGYSVYSEDTVYMIVPEMMLGNVFTYDPELVKGHKDIIYNSFLEHVPNTDNPLTPISPSHETLETQMVGPLEERIISTSTFTDPLHTPEIALRHFDTFIDVTDEGAIMNLEYYVDTWDYSSNCPKLIDPDTDTVTGVGDTFTTIIENQYGEEVYNRTTYAGTFKVKVPLVHNNEPIVGKTYFSIRAIDTYGRESVTLFYDVLVKGEDQSKGMYHMTEADLINYGFISQDDDPNNAAGVFCFAVAGSSDQYKENNIDANPEYRTELPKNYKHDKRNNYFAGYRNKLALEKLMLDKKAENYSGVVLYNHVFRSRSLDDSYNTVYLIDCHSLKAEGNHPALKTGFTNANIPWPETATTAYTSANSDNYPNDVFVAETHIYLVKAVQDNDGVWKLYNPATDTFIPTTAKSAGNGYSEENLRVNELTIVTGNDDSKYVQVKFGANDTRQYPLEKDSYGNYETLADFIRRDGLGIRRSTALSTPADVDATGHATGDILTVWSPSDKEQAAEGTTAAYPMLCVKKISQLGSSVLRDDAAASDAGFIFTYTYTDDKGKLHEPVGVLHNVEKRYYPYFYIGERITSGRTSRTLHIPNDFTLDCNNCTLLSTFGQDLNNKEAPCVVDMRGCVNSHLKNAKLIGLFGSEMVKEAFLNYQQTESSNGEWEKAKIMPMGASCFCTLTNVHLENSPGYELTSDGVASAFEYANSEVTQTIIRNQSSRTAVANQLSPRYIDYTSGSAKAITGLANITIKDENGKSLIPQDADCYAEGRQIALMSSNIENGDISNIRIMCNHSGFSTDARMRLFTDRLVFRHNDWFFHSFRAGKFHTFFVHFFKKETVDGVTKYTYLRSYKTRDTNPIYRPANATNVVVSPYVVIESDGTIVTEKVPKTSTYRILGIHEIVADTMDYTTSGIIDSCKVDTTKSAAMVGPSINMTIKDCVFSNINTVEYWCRYTNALYHIEERACVTNHLTFLRCKCVNRESLSLESNGKLGVGRGRYTQVIDCDGMSFSGMSNQYYIEGCKLTSIGCGIGRYYYNTVRGIVKNTTSNKVNQENGYGFTNISMSKDLAYDSEIRNTCDDPLNVNIAINDSLIVSNTNNIHTYGRRYQANVAPFDQYSSEIYNPYENFLIVGDGNKTVREDLMNGCVMYGFNTGLKSLDNMKVVCRLFYYGIITSSKQRGGKILQSGTNTSIVDSVFHKYRNYGLDNNGAWATIFNKNEYISDSLDLSHEVEEGPPMTIEYVRKLVNGKFHVTVSVDNKKVIDTDVTGTNSGKDLYMFNRTESYADSPNKATDITGLRQTQFRGGVAYLYIYEWKDNDWSLLRSFVPAYNIVTRAELESWYPGEENGYWRSVSNSLQLYEKYGKQWKYGATLVKEVNNGYNADGTRNTDKDLYSIAGMQDNQGKFYRSTGGISFSGILSKNGQAYEQTYVDDEPTVVEGPDD